MRLLRVSVWMVAAFMALTTGARAAPGDLDPGFGVGGVAVLPSPSGYLDLTHLSGLGVAPDGGVAVVGNAFKPAGGSDLVVGRLTAAGTPDTRFGGGRLVPVAPFTDYYSRIAGAVVALPDGGVLVAAPTGEPDAVTVLLARLKPTGELDGSFGSGGIVHFDVAGTVEDVPTAIGVLADGRIVLGGYSGSPDPRPHSRFLIARFLPSGGLDQSFGGSGYTTRAAGPADFQAAQAMALEPDGRITLAGTQGNLPVSGLVARYRPDAALDDSFGVRGFVGPGSEGTQLSAVARAGNGTTIAAGDWAGWPYAARIVSGPAPDTSSGAYVWTSVVKGSDRGADITGIAVDSGGRTILAGTGTTDTTSDAMLVVLDGAGALDPVVGGSPPGIRFHAVPGHRLAEFRALGTAPGGGLLLAGAAFPDAGSASHAVVLRVQAPPPSTNSGGGSGGGGVPAAGSKPQKSLPLARISGFRARVTINLRTGRGTGRATCASAVGDVCVLSLALTVPARSRRANSVRRVKVGTAKSTLRGGHAGKVAFRLSRKGLARLRHAERRRLRVIASGTSKNRSGGAVPVRRRVTLAGSRAPD